MKIEHMAMYVNDLDAARDFFVKYLGGKSNDGFEVVSVPRTTGDGYSDWAITEIPASVKTMWYRLSRREDDYCIECSDDGQKPDEE
jgi:regulation of enolase protein 1 (concanavalin A-like superfamily)